MSRSRSPAYVLVANNSVQFTEAAFLDQDDEPSLDRAQMLMNDPTRAQKAATDGVVTLLAGYTVLRVAAVREAIATTRPRAVAERAGS